MPFSLFSKFILWIKGIFHIPLKAKYKKKESPVGSLPKKRPVEVTQPSEEKLAEVSPAEEKPGKVPLPEERLPEIPSEEKTPEVLPEEIPTAELPQESEEEAKTKTRKPYKRKAPTEERKKEREEPPEDEEKPASPKQRKKIDLGERYAKRPKTGKPPQPDEEDKVPKEREVTTRVESPFIEIDLDEAKIFLTIPKQQFKPGTVSNIPQQLNYKLEINGEEQSISVKVSSDDQGTAKVGENRIELERPLKSFQVLFPDSLFPDKLQGRTYSYNHNNENLYAFVAIGNNRGRMYYLYDKDGNINHLPNRMVWLLLHEDFKLEIESNYLTEETWIWEKYRPFRVNLKEMNELVIKNTKTDKEYKLSCEPTFSIEGQVIEDDFKDQMPLLISETIKIKAPRENPYGWTVWIQSKIAGYRIITENWNGVEPLSLKLPDDLPCEYGEFQVDICQQDTRISDETLFFRWLPFIKLNYPKKLIIPNPRQGHKSEFIKVNVSGEGWTLNHGADRRVGLIESNSYQIELRPEENTARFSITKGGKPETDTKFQITIPRLKWKTSKHEAWNGKLQNIKRDELIYGESFYLLICTNDFNNKYDLSAILETNGQRVQEGKFIRQGINYNLELNQFYDTIKRNRNEITLKIKIWKAGGELVNNVETLQFPAEMELIKKRPKQKIRREKPRLIFPKAIVKKPSLGKKRSGKGYSRQEIIAAGIDINNIHCLSIPFDKRRKSLHDWNVKTLQSIIRGDEHTHRSNKINARD